MTNSLHRRGTAETLKQDYVIFASPTHGPNEEDTVPKVTEFLRICLKHHPVNIGSLKIGSLLPEDTEFDTWIANLKNGTGATAVFADLDALQKVVEDLCHADLGISINVSGLLEDVQECCHNAGIERHSAEQSLGVWGSKDRLPEREILEVNSLCGHGMISFNLIRKMIEYVRIRRLTPKEASDIMSKCCACRAFNPARAETLLVKMQERGFFASPGMPER